MKTMPLFDHVLRLGMTSALLSLAGSALGQAERVDIYVEDPRPVAEAVSVMTSRHPVVITYEDPRYEYAGDMQDVTEQARNPLNSQTRGNRVLVPRGGSLHANYEVSAETGKPIDVRETLNAVLGLNYLSDAGARYLVQQTGDVFHVVPVAARNGDGDWVPQTSILDVPITLSTDELNGYELTEAVLREVSEASGIRVDLGAHRVLNTLFRHRGRVEATNEPARDVLLRLLHSMSERLSWLLFYGPSEKHYAFNVTVVAEELRHTPPDGLPQLGHDDVAPTGRPLREPAQVD